MDNAVEIMIILNFILNHLGLFLILAGLAIVVLILWAFWEDEKRFDKPPVPKSKHIPSDALKIKVATEKEISGVPPWPGKVPPADAPQFKTPFQTAAHKAIEAELDASRNHTINHFKSGSKPHPKPKKH